MPPQRHLTSRRPRRCLAAVLMFLTACAAESVAGGNARLTRPDVVEQIRVGVSRTDDVLQLLGEPGRNGRIPVDGKPGWRVWAYGYTRTSGDGAATDRGRAWTLVLTFDAEGVLREKDYRPDTDVAAR